MFQLPSPAGSPETVRRLVPLVALLAAAAAVVGLVSRSLGGRDNAQAVIEQAFSGDSSLRSGRFEADLKLSLTGVPGAPSSPVTMAMDGAFQDQGEGRLPKLDLDVSVGALERGGEPVRLGLISTGNRMYVGFEGRHYVVPDREVSRLVAQREARQRDGGALLRSVGLDPTGWTKNEKAEGTERVGGVETTHVSADVDVARMLEDLTKLAGAAPRPEGAQAPPIPAGLVQQVRDAVKEAKLDIYVGTQDKVIRRVELQVAFETDSPTGPVKGDLELGLDVSDVNKPLSVEAPPEARPFGELRSAFAAFQGSALGGGLGGSPAAGSTSRPPAASPAPPTAEPAGTGSGPHGSRGEAVTSGEGAGSYLSCVEKAESPSELQGCAPLLDR